LGRQRSCPPSRHRLRIDSASLDPSSPLAHGFGARRIVARLQYQTWCEFWEVFHHGGAARPSVEQDFRRRKPYLVGETGSVEDTSIPGRKGQWMLNMRNRIKSEFPNLRALLYSTWT
jgi:hypothetical protein